MKKLGLITLISVFTAAVNLHAFDLIEDTFEFIFEDIAKIIGIFVIIAAVVFAVKKYMKKDSK
ncbi:hypothetical protein [uncultured Brachyspira sp.]|uniref:hypothetical protein n=1 Tax=uncultured Brachyspira sp. TaxID=221953 RepID=UPI0025EC755B|nr:hypothetical protein [uncultured Brachyspira sp.]